MKRIVFLSIALASTMFAPAYAESFQNSVDIKVNFVEMDKQAGETSSHNTRGGLEYTRYLSPVDNGAAPLNEVPFLAHASNVHIGIDDTNIANDHTTVMQIGGEYYTPNNFYVGADFHRASGAQDHTLRYAVEFGYMPLDNLLITGGAVGLEASGLSADINPSARIKYVGNFGSHALGVSAYGVFGNNVNNYTADLDFYFNHTLSVGASHTVSDRDGDKGVTTALITKYVDTRLKFGGSVDFSDGNTSVGLFTGYRF